MDKLFFGGRLCLAVLILLLASGCGVLKSMDHASAFTDRMYDAVRSGRLEETVRHAAVDQRKPYARANLEALSQRLPQTPRGGGFTTRYHVNHLKGPQTAVVTRVYRHEGQLVEVQARLTRPYETAPWALRRMDARIKPAGTAAPGGWLIGKSALHYGVLFMTLASPLVMLAAFITVLTTPGLPRKGLWAVIALVGIGVVWMDWDSGRIGGVPIAVNLLGSGIWRGLSPFDPWMLRFSVPVGALIALAYATGLRPKVRKAPAGS